VEYVPLEVLMRDSDVISINVLLNETTRGLINARLLNLMKDTAYLINTSRAAVIDREALIEALQCKRIAGAALDVHDAAPCLPNDLLVSLDNVLATPWSAFNTEESIARMSIIAAQDIVNVLAGRLPKYPVNRPGSSDRP
jgi:D-3-phosphoglycerate dehydrogenase